MPGLYFKYTMNVSLFSSLLHVHISSLQRLLRRLAHLWSSLIKMFANCSLPSGSNRNIIWHNIRTKKKESGQLKCLGLFSIGQDVPVRRVVVSSNH